MLWYSLEAPSLEVATTYIFMEKEEKSLGKHAYSNILKILPSKTENFQIKNSDIFHNYAQHIDCGTHWNCLIEAFLTNTHNLVFEQK